MFEVGFSELLLIFVLALLVLGPQKLPKLAAQVGRWMGRARAMARQFREQLEDEASLEETLKAKPKPKPKARTNNDSNTAAATTTLSAAGLPEDTTSLGALSPGAQPSGDVPPLSVPPGIDPPLDAAELTPHAPIEDYIAAHADTAPNTATADESGQSAPPRHEPHL